MDVQHFANIGEEDSVRLKTLDMTEIEEMKLKRFNSRMLKAICAACLVIIALLLACLILLAKDHSERRQGSVADDVGKLPTSTPAMVVRTDALQPDIKIVLNDRAFCTAKYDGKCFWGTFAGDGSTTLQNGNFYCSQFGGQPATLYSKEHFIAIKTDLLRKQTRYDADAWLGVWTAMLVDRNTGHALFPNGTRATFLDDEWADGFPKIGPNVPETLYIAVKEERGILVDEGLGNGDPKGRYYGVLCEI